MRYLCETYNTEINLIDQEISCLFTYYHHSLTLLRIVSVANLY